MTFALSHWFRSIRTKSAPGKRRRNSHRRPIVEGLESRALLTTFLVDINDPSADLPGDNLYAQIQEAVDAASPGDQIKVEAGTYQPFVVPEGKNNLTIREANANSNPVIDADGGLFGVKIEANGVTIRGLEARNATSGDDDAFAFTVTGNNNTLINNIATDSTHGFDVNGHFGGGDGNLLIGNTALRNGVGFEVVVGADNNMLVGNTAVQNEGGIFDLETSGNTYINNTADGNEVYGIGILFSVDTRLVGNRANDNFVGFVAQGSEDITFIANRAEDNGRDGFQILLSSNVTFNGNTANDNENDGFRLIGVFDSTFTGNTASGNERDGFSIDNPPLFGNSSGNVFTGNKARDNGRYGVYVDPDSLDNVFMSMVCLGNILGGSNLEGIC